MEKNSKIKIAVAAIIDFLKTLYQKYMNAQAYYVVLTLFLFVFMFILSLIVASLENINEAIQITEHTNTDVQRWVRMELSDILDQELSNSIDERMAELETIHLLHSFETTDSSIANLFVEINQLWQEIKLDARFERDYDWYTSRLTILADEINEAFINLSHHIELVYELRTAHLWQIMVSTYCTIGFLIYVTFKKFFELLKLQKNTAELHKIAYIDEQTGLYNRSRCQYLLREKVDHTNLSTILLFDLNDLKQTNDTLGHNAGDQLIEAFATALTLASDNNPEELPFIGRFGGDEYIVYFNDNLESTVNNFLTSVKDNCDTFNQKNKSFKISYAVGTARLQDYPDVTTIKDFLQYADHAMYEHKLAIKSASTTKK